MTSTRAIVSYDTTANDGWKLENVTVREPGEGELLIEMVASGICHTDALVGGLPAGAAPIAFYPRVLGHEGTFYAVTHSYLRRHQRRSPTKRFMKLLTLT